MGHSGSGIVYIIRSPSARRRKNYVFNRSEVDALDAPSLAADFRIEWRVVLHAIAPAAMGATWLRRFVKFRRVAVQGFCLQGVVQGGRAEIRRTSSPLT